VTAPCGGVSHFQVIWWTHDSGRGTVDMKCGTAVAVLTFLCLAQLRGTGAAAA
jgi:hypothetical protein